MWPCRDWKHQFIATPRLRSLARFGNFWLAVGLADGTLGGPFDVIEVEWGMEDCFGRAQGTRLKHIFWEILARPLIMRAFVFGEKSRFRKLTASQ
jgi:hypothetical protein